MIRKTLFAAAAALLLSGCTTTCPQIVAGKDVEVQRVEVPVETARVPPPALLSCWDDLPAAPVFEDGPEGSNYVLLRQPEQDKYKALMPAVRACMDRWHVWATAAPEAAK